MLSTRDKVLRHCALSRAEDDRMEQIPGYRAFRDRPSGSGAVRLDVVGMGRHGGDAALRDYLDVVDKGA